MTTNFLKTDSTKLIITTPKGLSSILKEEIKFLGYHPINVNTMSVTIKGNFLDAMRLNLHLRCAHHVLYQLNEFPCDSPDELYNLINRMPWETIISPDEYLSVVSIVDHPSIRDSRFANMKCKDAIVDRISSRNGRRPDSGPEKTGVVISIYWKREYCNVYLDTSGEPLSRRGYRMIPMNAPMQETLAAGIILTTGKYNGERNFINPMCGSGTIAIEAALIQANIAPGLIRKNYSFLHSLLCNKSEWNELRVNARSAIKVNTNSSIIATDIDEEAIGAAKKNAEFAGVADKIDFKVADIRDTPVPEGGGLIMINPEYGIRLGNEDELENSYRKIGGYLKNDCTGYAGYVFTANTKLAGKIGLKSKRKFIFFSGTIECRLYEYELYAGKREKDQ